MKIHPRLAVGITAILYSLIGDLIIGNIFDINVFDYPIFYITGLIICILVSCFSSKRYDGVE